MAPRARGSRAGRAASPSVDPAVVARAVDGETEAQNQVFDRERDMIRRLARQRADQGLSFEDLVQEGSLGLLSAMHEYVGGVDAAFDEYAEIRVGEHMDSALRDEQAALAEERRLAEDATAFEEAEIALRRELGRAATPAEMQQKLAWTDERLDEVASAVADARQRHDEELLTYIDPDYLDPLEWLGQENGEGEAGRGGRDA